MQLYTLHDGYMVPIPDPYFVRLQLTIRGMIPFVMGMMCVAGLRQAARLFGI
jgi:hypothetical protein